MNRLRLLLCVAGVIAFAQSARAQVPFFFPGASAFTPEISIVNTGVMQDVQATVSADQKYVTLNMRASSAKLLALDEFKFQQQQPALGFVGDPANRPAGKNIVGNANVAKGNDDPASAVRSSPSDILAAARENASVLQRPGMTRLGDRPGR